MRLFLSAVTTGGGLQRRQDIAESLRAFTSLNIVPVYQEQLLGSVLPDGDTVSRLVINVRSADVVCCLLDQHSGYPENMQDRLRVVAQAQTLLKQAGTFDPGALWQAWCNRGEGMTYTQLEFFCAAALGKRTKVFWPKSSDQPQSNQNPLIAFLRDHHMTIDRGYLENAEREVCALAVDYAVVLLNAAAIAQNQLDARIANLQGLVRLQDLNARWQLFESEYDIFYRDVLQRLTDPVIVCDHLSAPVAIRNRDLKSEMTLLQHPGGVTLATQTEAGCTSVTYSSDFKLLSQNYLQMESAERLCEVSPNGLFILTQTSSRQFLRDQQGIESVLEPVELSQALAKPDNNGQLITTPLADHHSFVPAMQSGDIELSLQQCTLTLPVDGLFCPLPGDDRLAMIQLTPTPDIEQLLIACYRPAQTGDLFKVASLRVEFDAMHCDISDQGVLTVADSSDANANFASVACSSALDVDLVAAQFSGVLKDYTGKHPPLDSEPCRCLWSDCGRYLLASTDDQEDDLAEVLTLWYFPRPLDHHKAGKLISAARSILNGQLPLRKT